jgi:hypothetical protein
MWYEIGAGLIVVGVLGVLTGLYRKGLSAMDRAEREAMEKRWLWGFVVGVVALWAVSAAAEPVNLGTFCWQLLTFEDRLKVEVIQRDPAEGDFALYATWLGQILPDPPVYTLQGGGSGVQSFDGTEFSISIPFRNATTFFLQQPIGRLTAVLTAPNLTGQWHADFVGNTPTAFVVRGTLRPVDCEEPNPPVSPARGSQSSGRLAGQ